MAFKNRFLDIKRNLKKFDENAINNLIILQVIFLLLPLFESFLFKIPLLPIWVLIVIFIIHAAIGILILFSVQNVKEILKLVRIDDLEEQYRKTKKDLENEREKIIYSSHISDSLVGQSFFLNYSLSVLFFLLKEKCNKPEKSDIEKLLQLMVISRSRIFGYTDDDLYNFSVFLHNPKTDKLENFWRSNDNRIEVRNRRWDRGVGHVGICFAQNKMIISPDTSVAPELIAIEEYTADSKNYASIASVPIQDHSSVDNKPIGVFVITSSRTDHLNIDLIYFIQQVAIILSIYFSECIIQSESEGEGGGNEQ